MSVSASHTPATIDDPITARMIQRFPERIFIAVPPSAVVRKKLLRNGAVSCTLTGSIDRQEVV